jgi:DNA primase small subunit
MNEMQFLQSRFGEYYKSYQPPIAHVEQREFGFGGWEKKIEFRHLAFKSPDELRQRLAREKPLYVSYSAAYYEFPDARPMPKKNWLGADLIFDLDAELHSCAPFICPECLEKIKAQTLKLVEDFLIPDFGFSKSEMIINFSGNRGYHVHVHSPAVYSLGRDERREIVNYIAGANLDVVSFFGYERDGQYMGPIEAEKSKASLRFFGPMPTDGGYAGKFAREMIRRARENPESLKEISTKLKKPAELEKFISGIERGNWDAIGISKREEKFKAIFDSVAVRLPEHVDANVTFDTSKLLRLPKSIHGGTGMACVLVNDFAAFDPMRDAVVFGGQPVSVKTVQQVPAIEMKNQSFGPYADSQTISVPEFFAIYLICKRAAVLA